MAYGKHSGRVGFHPFGLKFSFYKLGEGGDAKMNLSAHTPPVSACYRERGTDSLSISFSARWMSTGVPAHTRGRSHPLIAHSVGPQR
jgi:hypothetical protein